MVTAAVSESAAQGAGGPWEVLPARPMRPRPQRAPGPSRSLEGCRLRPGARLAASLAAAAPLAEPPPVIGFAREAGDGR